MLDGEAGKKYRKGVPAVRMETKPCFSRGQKKSASRDGKNLMGKTIGSDRGKNLGPGEQTVHPD